MVYVGEESGLYLEDLAVSGQLLNQALASSRGLYLEDLAVSGQPHDNPPPSRGRLYLEDLAVSGQTVGTKSFVVLWDYT